MCQRWVCEGFSSETVGGLDIKLDPFFVHVHLYIYVVVCLFVACVLNDAKPIWYWFRGSAVLGADIRFCLLNTVN